MNQQPSEADPVNRLLAALAYPVPFVIAMIIVVTDIKKDPFMRHHGWTALFWSVACLCIWFAVVILGNVPFLGWIFFILIGPLVWLAWLILSIYYAIQAYNGKHLTIPVVSDFASKYGT